MGFQIDFNIMNYKEKGILPSLSDYLKHDEVINYDDHLKGNVDLCVWKKQELPLIMTNDVIEREVTRLLKTGVWIAIKDEIVWIPPNYYQFLQYGTAGGAPPQFRLKRLKHVYFKIEIRNDPQAIGTYTVKNRQDGETTFAMNDCLWEMADGNMDVGSIGIQSKTRDTVMNSCWRTLVMMWNVLPSWLKNVLYSDYISGDRNAETMKFLRQASGNEPARNILAAYGPSVHNAFDSYNNMRRCVLDETNKWKECSFFATFKNYEQFIAPGTTRKGIFDIFSSPADENGKHNDEAFEFWKDSDPETLVDGTTKTRVYRYRSDPLEGVEGMYDKWGDADGEQIYAWIMKRRASMSKDRLMSEVRACPLSEEEMFGSFEGGNVWTNQKGISDRKVYIIGQRFKDSVSKEPRVLYGNLERVDGYMDGDVEFRIADRDSFDLKEARFCISYIPQNREPLRDVLKPPAYVENVLGVDPFNNRYEAKNVIRQSNGAMVNWKFRDIHNTGIVKCPTLIYCCRPSHQEIFFEDVLKAAIYNRAYIQYENRSDKLANYAEDRGYFDWLLPEIGAGLRSKRKGDAPSGGKNAFLNEGIGLIDAMTNLPLTASDPYLMDRIWFTEMLDDVLKFNPRDTHANDLTMAWIQALIGAVKVMHKKIRQPSDVTTFALEYLLS
jgi:hypothetical protein